MRYNQTRRHKYKLQTPIYALDSVEVVWSVKHASVAASFVDAGAAQFFADRIAHTDDQHKQPPAVGVSRQTKYTAGEGAEASAEGAGAALGPHWVDAAVGRAAGALQSAGRRVHVVHGTELERIVNGGEKCDRTAASLPPSFQEADDWPVRAVLTDGQAYGCDLILLATGVEPNTDMWTSKCPELRTAADSGILVDDQFESSVPDVFAVGDACTCGWPPAPHWLQMRLWTQAQQQAVHAADCLRERHRAKRAGRPHSGVPLPIAFEIFTHLTEFFGYKVILLGKFNGQGLPADTEALVRVTKGQEYIKVLVHDGRVHGAILIGDTDLEETIENLILNQIDVEAIKDGLLDPSIDIEDYFD